MLFSRDPDMPIAPSTEIPELLYFGMPMLHVILDWKAHRVIDSDIATKPEEDTGCLKSKKAGIRPK